MNKSRKEYKLRTERGSERTLRDVLGHGSLYFLYFRRLSTGYCWRCICSECLLFRTGNHFSSPSLIRALGTIQGSRDGPIKWTSYLFTGKDYIPDIDCEKIGTFLVYLWIIAEFRVWIGMIFLGKSSAIQTHKVHWKSRRFEHTNWDVEKWSSKERPF